MRLEDRLTPYAVGLHGANPVHEYLTNVGYNVFARQFGETTFTALPNGISRFVTGARDEDVQGAGPLGDSLPFGGHFWAHDVFYGRARSNGLFRFESAPARSDRLLGFGGGIAATYATDKAEALYRWGHVAHLLQDMTVPAHAHADPHFEHPLPEDPDPYHDWVDGLAFIDFQHVGPSPPDFNRIAGFYADAGLRYITYASIADYDRKDLRRPDEITGQFADPLTNLFYENARAADFYDTKDYVGRGNGSLISDRGTLILVDTPLAVGVRQFFPAANYDTFSFDELNTQAADLVPRAVKSTAEAIRTFFSLVDTQGPTVALPRLCSTRADQPQAFATGWLDLTAAATDQDSGDSGIGKDHFRIEVAEVNADGSLGPSRMLTPAGSGSHFSDGGPAFGNAFAGRHGASATVGMTLDPGKVYAVRASAEDGAGHRADSPTYYLRYGEPTVTEITVIDRSSSMDGGPLQSAIASASAALGTRNDYDRIGVVGFSSSASVLFPLTTIEPGSPARERAQQAIAGLTASGTTSIGSGLLAAVGLLDPHETGPDCMGQTSIVVLTDGEENEAPYIADVEGQIPGYVAIHGIALGRGADAGSVERLARNRNGQFYAAEDEGDLPAVYARVSGAVSGEQDVARRAGSIRPGGRETMTFEVDASAGGLTVGVTWPGSDLDLSLIGPDGRVYTRVSPGGGRFAVGGVSEFFRIAAAMPGTWTAVVDAVDVAAGGEPFEVFARVATPLVAELLTPSQTLAAGDILPIRLRLAGSGGPVLGAIASVALIPPDPSDAPALEVTLFDDGTHGDEVAGDGVYSNAAPVGAMGGGVYTLQALAVGPGFVRAPSQLLLITGSAPANTDPTISPIVDQSARRGAAIGPIAFAVGDAETPAGSLRVVAASSDQQLLPDAHITIEGTGADRRILLTPTPGKIGSATVTLTVTDTGGRSTTTRFRLNVTPAGIVPSDFDGDGVSDLVAYCYDADEASGLFQIRLSTGGTRVERLGGPHDVPVSGDFDGDGRADVAVFQPDADLDGDGIPDAGRWHILRSSDGERQQVDFGGPGGLDRPAPADYDGDGITDIATFRPSSDLTPGAAEWFILRSRDGALRVPFGAGGGGDLPAPADYDGDGKDDIATFRPSPTREDFTYFDPEGDGVGAQWFLLRSSAGAQRVEFGATSDQVSDILSDQPVAADYDSDGLADIAAFRSRSDLPDAAGQADWFVLRSRDGAYRFPFGDSGSLGAPADYDGDGRPDLAVFDPVGGRWAVMASTGIPPSVPASLPGGVPVGTPLAYRLLATGNNPGVGPSPLRPAADTALLLPFDGTTLGLGGEAPLSEAGVEFVRGLFQQAARVGDGGSIRYGAADAIDAAEGTVEFWIRPDWDGDEGIERVFFQVGNAFDDGLLLAIDAADNLRFIAWGDDPDTPAIESDVERDLGASAASWRAGQWHHIAATWSRARGEQSFYVDGRSVGRRGGIAPVPGFSTPDFVIGSAIRGDRPSEAAFEEFRISRKARSAAEIAEDYLAAIGAGR